MQDVDLYREILGISSPWKVVSVKLDLEAKRVDVTVDHDEGQIWKCPQCDQESVCYDHSPERAWRHLDTCQFKTFVHARVPRVKCPIHGVVQVTVSWAGKFSRFTLLMERLVIDVLQACETVVGACRILDITWDQAWGVMERAVLRGKSRKKARVIERIGVDEKAFKKGQSYMTVVCDIDSGTVEYVAEDRKKSSLAGFFSQLTPEQILGIEAIAMDMWEPYYQAVLESVPLARDKIVFDRFHIMQHATKAVDAVRKQEHRRLLLEGDESLKKTKYLWLASEENVPEDRRKEFHSLKESDLATARAWAIKENLRHLWTYCSPGWARRFFEDWYSWATRSRLEPIRQLAATVKAHIDNIVTYCKHYITNAVSEGLNSRIMGIKRRAGGFRNPENFKTAIYFHCGGLALYP